MKERLLLLTILLFSVIGSEATESNSQNTLKDSILAVYQSLPDLESQMKYTHDMYARYNNTEWIENLLESALITTQEAQDNERILEILYISARHASQSGDSARYVTLREKIFEYNKNKGDYSEFFRLWRYNLQFLLARGDSEAALQESELMYKKAIEVNSDFGVIIAYLCRAQSLATGGRFDEAIAQYEIIENDPRATNHNKMSIHQTLFSIYSSQQQVDKAVESLDNYRYYLNLITENSPEKKEEYRDNYLENEIGYCSVYARINDKENLGKHLREGSNYYRDECPFFLKINYYLFWANYYEMMGDKKNCYENIDIAISLFNSLQPLREISIIRTKAKMMLKFGDFKDAAELYRRSAYMGDSINQDILKRHERVFLSNYRIQKALLDKEDKKRYFQIIYLFAAGILLLSTLFFLIRTYHIKKFLTQSERKTRESLANVEAANKMKEVFMHNITKEIEAPLNVVMKLCKQISSSDHLTAETMQTDAAIIRENSTALIELVNNVLDLSRLEAGMMKFDLQVYDAVQLLNDEILHLKIDHPEKAENIYLHIQEPHVMIKTDVRLFINMIQSIMAQPDKIEPEKRVILNISCDKDNCMSLTCTNDYYSATCITERERIIQTINSLFVKHFEGSYQVSGKNIMITYPLARGE